MTRLEEIVAELSVELEKIRPNYSPNRYRLVLPKGQQRSQGTKVYAPDGRELTGVLGVDVSVQTAELITAQIRVHVVVEESGTEVPTSNVLPVIPNSDEYWTRADEPGVALYRGQRARVINWVPHNPATVDSVLSYGAKLVFKGGDKQSFDLDELEVLVKYT